VSQNDSEALRLHRLAADQGNANAQQALGLIYFNGLAGVTQSYAEAVRWYTLAADQGLALAQSELGVLYANGQSVPRDYVRTHMWFNLSAAQGEKAIVTPRTFSCIAPRLV
jgi:TPR repeat protein